MAANENVFNFDVSPFLAGVNKIGEGMGRIEGNAKKFGSTITGAVNKSVNGLILKVGGLIAAFKSAGAVLKQMPEVGQAFGLAKDIFLKNLLWPLRQQVMPLLQKMMDWVRDNRAMFVKWGTTVANIFRTVVVVAKTLWEVFKSLVKTVGEAFQKAFNTNFKSFDEFLNVLSFKISAVIIFMGMLAKQLITDFKPAFDWIIDMGATIVRFFLDLVKAWTTANEQGSSLWTIIDKLKTTFSLLANFISNAVKGFTEGFLPAVRNLMTPIDTLVASFNQLLMVLGFGDSDGIRGAFSFIGTVLGSTLTGALTLVVGLVDELVSGFGMLLTMAKGVARFLAGDFKGSLEEFGKVKGLFENWQGRADKQFSTLTGSVKDYAAPYLGAIQGISNNWSKNLPGLNDKNNKNPDASVHDGIVTKNGKVVKVDPEDNIFAAKKFTSSSDTGKQKKEIPAINMPMGPFYFTVTEGNAEQAGRNFGTGVAYSFRNNVSNARLAEGR